MKIKKLALLLLVLVFSMTACSSGQGEVEFNYDQVSILNSSLKEICFYNSCDEASKIRIKNPDKEDESAQLEVFQGALSNFENTEKECGKLKSLAAKKGSSISYEDIYSSYQQILKLESENEGASYWFSEELLMSLDTEIKEVGNTVHVVFKANYEDREANIELVYSDNKAGAFIGQRDKNSPLITVIPYKLTELTISPDYSFGEKMTKAAMNTLMGMGSVFVILIFIALIIGQFERLSKAIVFVSDKVAALIANIKNRKNKKNAQEAEEETKEDVVPAPVVAAPVSNDLMNDSQLVAVITAAIMAAQSEAGNPGSDGLIVRSIRKAKR